MSFLCITRIDDVPAVLTAWYPGMEGGNAIQIADQAAREGILDLRASGLQKGRDGVTSLEEVNRVTID